MTLDIQDSPSTHGANLEGITRALRRQFVGAPPVGFVAGRTRIRDAVMSLYRCSALRAATLVEQLQSRGFIHFEGDPRTIQGDRAVWRFIPQPTSTS